MKKFISISAFALVCFLFIWFGKNIENLDSKCALVSLGLFGLLSIVAFEIDSIISKP
jgi:hypothetical protein